MDFSDAIEKISSILGKPKKSKKEYTFKCVNNDCPSHLKNHQKLSLNIETGKWHCWVCDISGLSVNSLLRKCGFNLRINEKENLANFNEILNSIKNIDNNFENIEKVKIPNEFVPLVSCNNKECDYFKQAIKYLLKRNISIFDIIKYNIHYNTIRYQILIPSYDNNGDITTYFIRSIFSKYKIMPNVHKTKLIFNEIFIDWNSPITIVEGVFDALSAGDNSVPLLGSSLKEDHFLFKKIIDKKTKVYLALDSDAKEKMMKLAKLFFSFGIKVNIIEINDGDINEIGRKEFLKLKKKAYLYSDIDEVKNRLKEL